MSSPVKDKRIVLALKVVLWVAALAPGAWLFAGVFMGWLGANPIEKLTRVSGLTALILLLVTLAVTPVRRLTGWNPVIRLRRPLGLFAFFYAAAHFTVWFAVDMLFDLGLMIADVAERPYITVGFTAFRVLLPLAVTSTKGWIRRLGKRWSLMHRGIYLATALGVVHFYWLVKADTRLPLLLAAIFVVLILLRAPTFLEARAKRARRERAGAAAPTPTR